MEDIRVIKSKEALFDTLLNLLKSNNFDSITVSQLCKEARVNRSTFYAHYTNIDELFNAHFKHILADLEQRYILINQKLLSPATDSMVPLYEHIFAHRKVYDVLLSEHAPMTYALQFQQAIMDYPSEIITRHLDKRIDLDLYYAFCSGATYGMIYHWKKTNYQLTPQEMGVYTVTFFKHQLTVKK